MMNLMLQLQLLLAALSAFLPLIPDEHRTRAAAFLDIAAQALSAGNAIGANVDDLATKFAAIRADVETMAVNGRAVSAGELDAALARVRNASAAFRAALETAETADP